ncbi:MAG: hypothetical protein AB8B91_13020 [Rubripirellula sp.]
MATRITYYRPPITVLTIGVLAIALCGCNNRAHTDLYQQRLAGEVRVLEDQLYDADYQNRVLQDKVEQLKRAKEEDCKPTTTNFGPSTPPPAQPYHPPTMVPEPVINGDLGMEQGFESELSLPAFDAGIPVDPSTIEGPPIEPIPLRDSNAQQESTDRLLPAPGGPEPPSKADTEIPQVEEGPIAPPPGKEEGDSSPPNQIILPDSVQASANVPEGLRLHTGLSGGTWADNEIQGMTVVVNVVDKLGQTVDLGDFDIDAEMSIVVLDPEREGDSAKLGRWDFDNEEVAQLIKSTPVSGFHVPIQWDQPPLGEEVIVHVRLRAEDDEMRCDGALKVAKKTVIADWTPRADTLR